VAVTSLSNALSVEEVAREIALDSYARSDMWMKYALTLGLELARSCSSAP
jgi:hypothetical protein